MASSTKATSSDDKEARPTTPPRVSFGVEIEFMIAMLKGRQCEAEPKDPDADISEFLPKAHWMPNEFVPHDELFECLVDHGIPVYYPKNGKRPANYVRKIGQIPWATEKNSWTITGDFSVYEPGESQYEWSDVELISPPCYAFQEAFDMVALVANVVRNNFRTRTNPTCGIHVHVGNGPYRLDLRAARNYAALMWALEPLMSVMHDPIRVITRYSESNRMLNLTKLSMGETAEDSLNRMRNMPNWAARYNGRGRKLGETPTPEMAKFDRRLIESRKTGEEMSCYEPRWESDDEDWEDPSGRPFHRPRKKKQDRRPTAIDSFAEHVAHRYNPRTEVVSEDDAAHIQGGSPKINFSYGDWKRNIGLEVQPDEKGPGGNEPSERVPSEELPKGTLADGAGFRKLQRADAPVTVMEVPGASAGKQSERDDLDAETTALRSDVASDRQPSPGDADGADDEMDDCPDRLYPAVFKRKSKRVQQKPLSAIFDDLGVFSRMRGHNSATWAKSAVREVRERQREKYTPNRKDGWSGIAELLSCDAGLHQISYLVAGQDRSACSWKHMLEWELARHLDMRDCQITAEVRSAGGSLDGEWIATWARIQCRLLEWARDADPAVFMRMLCLLTGQDGKEVPDYDFVDFLQDIGLYREARVCDERLLKGPEAWYQCMLVSKKTSVCHPRWKDRDDCSSSDSMEDSSEDEPDELDELDDKFGKMKGVLAADPEGLGALDLGEFGPAW